MSIYPDKKDGVLTGRWRVEVQLKGLRKRGRFNTHAEAKEAERKWTVELAAGDTAGATLRSDQTVPQRLSHLLAKAAPLLWNGSEHGELSEGKVKTLIGWVGDPLLTKLGTFVDDAIIRLREEGRSAGTINRYLSALHAVLAWGAKPSRGYVPTMPEFQWQDEDEGRIRYLTAEEETRLIATLRILGNDEIADLCIVALDTGCRRGELLSAKPDQLDGKWLRLWQTKSGYARSVPLSDRAQLILAKRLPWTVKEHTLRYAWAKARLAMGLLDDEDLVFHCLRHTRATRLVEMGVNLRVIQQFMGHRSIQTTLRYAHVSDDQLARTAQAIDAWNTVHLTARGGGNGEGHVPPQTPSEGVYVAGILEAVD